MKVKVTITKESTDRFEPYYALVKRKWYPFGLWESAWGNTPEDAAEKAIAKFKAKFEMKNFRKTLVREI